MHYILSLGAVVGKSIVRRSMISLYYPSVHGTEKLLKAPQFYKASSLMDTGQVDCPPASTKGAHYSMPLSLDKGVEEKWCANGLAPATDNVGCSSSNRTS
jgi:hypothetical protein